MLRTLLCVTSIAVANGFIVSATAARRTRMVAMHHGELPHDVDPSDVPATYDVVAFREWEECQVDAENAAELAACNEMPSDPLRNPWNSFMDDVQGVFRRFQHKPVPVTDYEECLISAENLDEIQACSA